MGANTRKIEVDAETAERLEARAAARGISVSELVAEFSGMGTDVPPDLEVMRREAKGPWSLEALAEDERRWDDYQRTGEAIPWEEVRAWLETWGTRDYRPFGEVVKAIPAIDRCAYCVTMTKRLEQAIEAARLLPPEVQDEIAQVILDLTRGNQEPEPIDPAHLPAVLEGLSQARRREFASDADVEAAFRRFDR